jgi:hypothetical protein
MNAFIFVSVICIGQACSFMTSMDTITEKECIETKKEFLNLKFKPEVTLAAVQCMEFKPGKHI